MNSFESNGLIVFAGRINKLKSLNFNPRFYSDPKCPEFVADQQYLGIFLSSAIMPEEYNIIINPHHPAYAGVTFKIEPRFSIRT